MGDGGAILTNLALKRENIMAECYDKLSDLAKRLNKLAQITSHQLRRCAQRDFSDGGDYEELDHGALMADIVELIESQLGSPDLYARLDSC